MPRLKPSKGRLVLTTVFPEEFQRWLAYELHNNKQWNPTTEYTGGYRKWKYTTKWWSIEWTGSEIIVTSDEPVVRIRQGLEIRMGSGEVRIGGQLP